jgi:glyoxylate/hydroxypyruvate reductase A
MPSVVIRVDPERRGWWKATLQEQLAGYSVYLWDEDDFDKDAIDFAVVWMPPLGALASLRNLRCVFSVGAGIAHIVRDETYPRHVPVVRTVSEDLRRRMTEYITLHVLRFHRRLPEIEVAHATATWKQFVEPLAKDVTVGILGVGNLGAEAAGMLQHLGYKVLGWNRGGRAVEGVEVFSGADGLMDLLARSRIVVAVLPGTSETDDVLDRDRLGTMPRGSYLINVGRGECVVDDDLVALLRSGHLAGATLDVCRSEPLAPGDPLWSAPNLLITAHTASAIDPAIGGCVISGNILAFDAGDSVPGLVDLDQGY